MDIHASSTIEDGGMVDPTASIGAHIRLPSSVRIASGAKLGDGVIFSSPLGWAGAGDLLTQIGSDVSIGGGAVILEGLTIGDGAQVAAGTVITDSVPPNAIVQGNPAAIIGYVNAATREKIAPTSGSIGVERVGVGDVTIHQFPVFSDIRGSLTVGEFEHTIPFIPRRYFMVFGVPSQETRGEHAHRECHQFLICVQGSCAVVVDDGKSRAEIPLHGPDRGVYLPPMTWGIQYKYSKGAMLLVFASHYYESEDYIREYSEFLKLSSDHI